MKEGGHELKTFGIHNEYELCCLTLTGEQIFEERGARGDKGNYCQRGQNLDFYKGKEGLGIRTFLLISFLKCINHTKVCI